jgi:hypothetical protein
VVVSADAVILREGDEETRTRPDDPYPVRLGTGPAYRLGKGQLTGSSSWWGAGASMVQCTVQPVCTSGWIV